MKIYVAGKKEEGQQELLITLKNHVRALAVFDDKCDIPHQTLPG